MIKLVIADDHDLVRAGIKSLLEAHGGMKVIGEAGTGNEAVKVCKQLKPDVLILDFSLPDIDGLEVTQKLHASQPDLKILILTMYDNEEYAQRLIQAGAAGFMVKSASPKELPDAVKKVASGLHYVTASIMENIVFRGQDPDKDPVSTLSDRELQVLIKLAQGGGSREIAEDLSLSMSTVKTYKARIMEKLGIKKIADLTRFAIRNGLIEK